MMNEGPGMQPPLILEQEESPRGFGPQSQGDLPWAEAVGCGQRVLGQHVPGSLTCCTTLGKLPL